MRCADDAQCDDECDAAPFAGNVVGVEYTECNYTYSWGVMARTARMEERAAFRHTYGGCMGVAREEVLVPTC